MKSPVDKLLFRGAPSEHSISPVIRRGHHREPLLIGIFAALSLAAYEWSLTRWSSADLFGGYRFQAWSSEDFMQEVHINDLLQVGPVGLWYLHVQPPMLESMRFLLALPEYLAGTSLSAQAIDQRMYGLYSVFFGILIAVVYMWVKSLTRSRPWAYAGALLVALYPGTVAMATLLDGTFPSAVLATIMLYLLYLAIRDRSASLVNWWLLSLLILSLTRTIFQLQILIGIPIVVVLLYRFRIGARTALSITLSVVLTALLFALPAKQFLLYDTTATTSFAGNHQIEVVSYRPTEAELASVEVPQDIIENAQNFVSGFNSPENIRLNYVLSAIGNDYYQREPFQVVKNLMWGVRMNAAQALHWTHDYSIIGDGPANIAADKLPWVPPSNAVLSALVYIGTILLTLMCLIYAFTLRGVVRRARTYSAFIFVSGAATLTFLLANRYDWTEADRLKYILVPSFIVIFVASLARATEKFRKRREVEISGAPLESPRSAT